MDPLTELLATALDEYLLTRGVAVNHEAVLAAIDPAKADWLRAGLLLGEVADWLGTDYQIALSRASSDHDLVWSASAWDRLTEQYHGQAYGDSAMAALTDLLAKLRVQP